MNRCVMALGGALAVAACNGSSGSDAGDVVASDASDVSNDVTDASDAADVVDAGADVPIGTGSVSLEIAEPIMMANFFVSFTQGAAPNCTERDDGPCHITVCSRADAGAGSTPVSAGDVTASGGTGASVVSQFMAGGYVAPPAMPASRWHAGDMVSFHAAGATVPSFDVMLPFPTALVVNTPDTTGNTFPPIDRSVGIRLTWSPATGSNDAHVVVQQSNRSGTVTVACRFDRSAGMAMIPPTALQDLQPGTMSSNSALIAIEAQNAQAITPGGYAVSMRTATIAVLTVTSVL